MPPKEVSRYCIMHKGKLVHDYTADFYGCLSMLKTMGPGRQMMRDDGIVVAFNPQQGLPTRLQYAHLKKGTSDEPDGEAP